MKLTYISLFFVLISTLITSFNIKINLTSSIPKGIYVLKENKIHIAKGDTVLFCLPGKYNKFILNRKYLSHGSCDLGYAPIGKKIVAGPKDHVIISKSGITVNGNLLKDTRPLPKDDKNRSLYQITIEKVLKENEFIVASSKRNSFDSRYFGIIEKKVIKGILEEVIVTR